MPPPTVDSDDYEALKEEILVCYGLTPAYDTGPNVGL